VPFTFLSHQAAVIPLKLARPSWWSGTALAIGSMAPDFEFCFQEFPEARWAHTPQGIVLFCLPATLVLWLLVERVVALPLAVHLPDESWLRLRDYAVLDRAPRGVASWARAIVSALVGSGTHVAWDSLTHSGPWVFAHAPALATPVFVLGDLPVRVTALIQLGSTIGGAFVTLILLNAIARRKAVLAWAGDARPPELEATRASRRTLVASVSLATVLGAIWGAWILFHIPDPSTYTLGQVSVRALFRTLLVAFAGLVLGCALARGKLEKGARVAGAP
jgi:hypothetical protein